MANRLELVGIALGNILLCADLVLQTLVRNEVVRIAGLRVLEVRFYLGIYSKNVMCTRPRRKGEAARIPAPRCYPSTYDAQATSHFRKVEASCVSRTLLSFIHMLYSAVVALASCGGRTPRELRFRARWARLGRARCGWARRAP